MAEFTPTLPFGPAPDLTSTAEERREWYKQVNGWKACRVYDVARSYCYWCLSDDDFKFMRKGTRNGTYMYCSEVCRDTAAMPRWN